MRVLQYHGDTVITGITNSSFADVNIIRDHADEFFRDKPMPDKIPEAYTLDIVIQIVMAKRIQNAWIKKREKARAKELNKRSMHHSRM